ncbi:gluconokinase [Microbacterium sp.]|uniref:gluconokinase n=1 Tax=Microbacterium sp. TaxID=51671 RepID=UPI0039E3233E
MARSVRLADAVDPLVLAIDIGSGSTRCCLYDGYGRPIKKRTVKVDHVFTEAADGSAEIDPDQVADEVAAVITGVVSDLEPGAIAGVAMDTFASSLVCVDADGIALTPCFTYADSRSAAHLAVLRERLDEAAVHQRIGARLHTSYHPPRLLWLRETRPDVVANTAKYVSLGEYVYARLAGIEGAATSTMAWAGILNRRTMDLDEELLAAVGVAREQFAPIVDPDQPIADVSPEVAERWPALAGAAWFPAVPDGYASNLGVGADDPSIAALSAATSGAIRVVVPGTPDVLPPGLWAYPVSRTQSIVGGALNDVGRVIAWLQTTLAPVAPEEIDDALTAAPRAETPVVLPFFTGERATGWAGGARAVFTGVSSSTTTLDIWRGAAEGVAISYARVFDQLALADPQLGRVVASGGVTGDVPGLMQLVAQAIGFPVQVVDVKRVTMRGTAVLALSVLQPGRAPAVVPPTAVIEPDPEQRPYYADLLARFTAVYDGVIAR